MAMGMIRHTVSRNQDGRAGVVVHRNHGEMDLRHEYATEAEAAAYLAGEGFERQDQYVAFSRWQKRYEVGGRVETAYLCR